MIFSDQSGIWVSPLMSEDLSRPFPQYFVGRSPFQHQLDGIIHYSVKVALLQSEVWLERYVSVTSFLTKNAPRFSPICFLLSLHFEGPKNPGKNSIPPPYPILGQKEFFRGGGGVYLEAPPAAGCLHPPPSFIPPPPLEGIIRVGGALYRIWPPLKVLQNSRKTSLREIKKITDELPQRVLKAS